jgi:hypothetical protein
MTDYEKKLDTTILALLVVLVLAFFAPFVYDSHRIKEYYLEEHGDLVCIRNDISWAGDTNAICLQDKVQAVQLFGALQNYMDQKNHPSTLKSNTPQ